MEGTVGVIGAAELDPGDGEKIAAELGTMCDVLKGAVVPGDG
jgi:hypothetical protein